MNHGRSQVTGLLAMIAGIVACGGGRPAGGRADAGLADDPERPGLAFLTLPNAVRLNGRFEVWARINDEKGRLVTADSQTRVTISASGAGTLGGTLTRRATEGVVVFDDLVYDRWESVTFTLRSSGFEDVTTRGPVPVRPLMRFVTPPAIHIAGDEPMGPVVIELVDGRGRVLPADHVVALDTPDAAVSGGRARRFTTGQVTYEQLVLKTAGPNILRWRSPGLGDLIQGVVVYRDETVQSLWLPAARVGVPYMARLPERDATYQLVKGALPAGLAANPGGDVFGIPVRAQLAQFQVSGERARGARVRWRVDLPVLPEAQQAASPSLDPLAMAGPFGVDSREDMVPVPSRRTQVRVRTFFPTSAGQVADGPLPLVVFHHGAIPHDPLRPTIFDRYDHLLRHWTSHGLVVATIDAPDLLWQDGRVTIPTLSNLTGMSENQRATIAYLRTRSAEAGFPLAGRLDTTRVIVAGHSRGAGGSLITAELEASVVGGILIKPVDPITTVGGEWLWARPLPAKPFLVVVAGTDGDLPYPMVDFLFERRRGPMVAVTVVGSIHSHTCDGSCPPDSSRPGISQGQDWAITNAFAVTFLRWACRGDVAAAEQLFGVAGMSTRLSPLGVFTQSDRGAAAVLIDDYQRGTTGRNARGLPNTDENTSLSNDEPGLLSAARMIPDLYQRFRTLYQRPDLMALSNAHRLVWSGDAGYKLPLGGADVRGRQVLALRARSEEAPFDPARLSVRFIDAEGTTATVAATAGANAVGERFSTVMFPLASLARSGIDLAQLDAATLVLTGEGSLLIDDLRFE